MSNEIITKEISTNEMLEISKLKPNRLIDGIKTSETMEKILYFIKIKISSALKQNKKNHNSEKFEITNENAFDIENFEKMVIDIFSRANMLDSLFSDLNNVDRVEELIALMDWEYDSSVDSDFNWEEAEKYYHNRPIVWIFFKWKPLFLNQNYLMCLWTHNLKELKEDIIAWAVFEKYYATWSDIKAKEYVSKLQNWESYEWLVLETKDWKKISWNSYWNKDWLEIRIWEDITYWRLNKEESNENKEKNNDLSLNTKGLINKFKSEVSKVIEIWENEIKLLDIFGYLSSILDNVWEKWQFLMNTTTEDKNWNKNFKYNLKYWKEIQKSDNVYNKNYSQETQDYINQLFKLWENEWMYVEDFMLNWKIYSWLRIFFESKLLWIKWSFGMWTDAKSKDIAELEKSL